MSYRRQKEQSWQQRLKRADRGLKHLAKTQDRRELLRAKGIHCQEWWWCEIKAGHNGPCIHAKMAPEEAL